MALAPSFQDLGSDRCLEPAAGGAGTAHVGCHRNTDRLELTKYNLDEATISARPAIEQWVFFFLRADRYEASRLRELLPGEEFPRAITALETITAKKEDRKVGYAIDLPLSSGAFAPLRF